jgi:RND family efflux transporter MFP subunit
MKSITYFFTFLLFVTTSRFVNANSYHIEKISVEPIHQTITRTGKLAFKRTLTLSFKNSGYLTKLGIDEGDYFEKNQLLASMDTAELKENKNATYSLLMQAKRDVNRITHLIEQNLSSERELEVAKTNLDTTRAEYKIAFYNLEKAQIIAPFTGVVLNRYAELGELMTPGRELVKVAALKNNWVVKVALTGIEVSQIKLQQKVKVRLHTLGDIEGVVTRIPAVANTSSLFMIDILLPQLVLKRGVVAGQIAEINITVTQDNFAYKLPIKALMALDDHGSALITMADKKEQGELVFSQRAFDIIKFDNNYIFLQAAHQAAPIQVVTNGWQHLSINEQK